MNQSVFDVPIVRRAAGGVFDETGVDLDSFVGATMVAALQAYPLAELFATSTDEDSRRLHALLAASAATDLDAFVGSARRRGRPRRWSTCRATGTPRRSACSCRSCWPRSWAGPMSSTPGTSAMARALLQVLMRVDADGDLPSYATGGPAQQSCRPNSHG